MRKFFVDGRRRGDLGRTQFLQIIWSQTLGKNVNAAYDGASDQLRMPDREHQCQNAAVAESHDIDMVELEQVQ